jgi:nitroreductase
MDPEELLSIIRNRRSIRTYENKPVEEEKIQMILEAGRWAPSAGNLQDIEYIVVKDPERKRGLYEASYHQNHILEAPINIVVCCNFQRISHYGERGFKLYSLQDSGASIQNMILTAHILGLGTCWNGAFNEEKAKQTLEIPDNVRPVAIISLGYPKESPKSSRRNLKEIIFKEKYGRR